MKLSWWLENMPMSFQLKRRAERILEVQGDLEVPREVNSIEKFARWLLEKA